MAGDRVGGMNINNLRYADDTVLIADKEEDIHNLLDEVDKQGREFGMRMKWNEDKSNDHKPECHQTRRNDIQQVSSFVYLGQS